MSLLPLALSLLFSVGYTADEPDLADAELVPTSPPAAPLAQDATALVCLSDGQVLTGTAVDAHDAWRTVRIGEAHVRVPDRAVGPDCLGLRPIADLEVSPLRTIILADGQELYGTPTELPDGLALDLLDEHRIYLPTSLVSEMRPLRKDVPGLEQIQTDRSRARQRKWLGVAAHVGLGVVSAAAAGGAIYGAASVWPEPEVQTRPSR